MKHTYLIREARESDAEAFLAYTKIVGSESNYLSFGKDGIPISIQEEADFIRNCQNDSHNAMWCAIDHEEIIAVCSFDAVKNKRMAHRASVGISVRKSYWNQGIATAMMQKLMEHAKALGDITMLTLEVICENEHAIHLYERFGFQISGCLHQFFRIDGKDYDAYIMECDLRKGALR